MKDFLAKNSILLSVISIVVFVVFVFVFKNGSEFSGADGQAENVISTINPSYEPWITNAWEPPSAEIESLLFSLQAAIGSGVLFFVIGYFKGLSAGRKIKSDL